MSTFIVAYSKNTVVGYIKQVSIKNNTYKLTTDITGAKNYKGNANRVADDLYFLNHLNTGYMFDFVTVH